MSGLGTTVTRFRARVGRRRRRRSSLLILPREHGALVMIGVALSLGTFAARGFNQAAIGLAALALGGLCLRSPLVKLMRLRARASPALRTRIRWSLAVYTSILALGVSLVLKQVELSTLAPIAMVTTPLVAVMLYSALRRQDRKRWSELVGGVLMALTAGAAHAVSTGQIVVESLQIVLSCALFFGSGILHIRGLFEVQRGRTLIVPPWIWSVAAAAVASGLAGFGVLTISLGLANLVSLLRLIALRGRLLSRASRVGLAELCFSVIFVALGLLL